METTSVALVLLGVAAATISVPSFAGDDCKDDQGDRRSSGMRAVAVETAAGQPGHAWRYFTDGRLARAVVISPEGEYFYSRGKRLTLVYTPAHRG